MTLLVELIACIVAVCEVVWKEPSLHRCAEQTLPDGCLLGIFDNATLFIHKNHRSGKPNRGIPCCYLSLEQQPVPLIELNVATNPLHQSNI